MQAEPTLPAAAADTLRQIWPAAAFSRTEVALLWCLLTHAGRPVSRDLLLHRVWGYAPGVASRTVETTIARVRAKIEPDPARPVQLLTLRGQGYQLNLPRAFAPVPPIPRLGPPLGRDGLLADLRCRLASGGARLITLIGPPGIGKTTAARRLLTELADGRPPVPVWFADLTHATDEVGFLAAAARALGGRGPLGEDEVAQRLGALQPCVGALDNLEQLPDEVARIVGRWLAAAPRLSIVATSHRPLGLELEEVVPVGPLDDDAAERLVRATLGRRALQGDDAAVREVVARSGGHPLALELAAPATAVGATSAWPSRRVDRPAHHQTLEALVDRALELLPAEAAERLVLASAFRGPLTPAVAAALWATEPATAGRALVELVERSLLVASAGGFVLPEALRACLAAHLRRAPDRAALYARYLAWAEGQRQVEEREVDPRHFEALLAEAPTTRKLIEVAMPALARAHGLGRCHALLLQLEPVDLEARIWREVALAACRIASGIALDEARERLERAEALAARRGADPETRFQILRSLAQLSRVLGRPDEADRRLDEAEAVARAAQDPWMLCDVLLPRCWIALDRGQDAAPLLDEAERAARELPDGALFLRRIATGRAASRLAAGDRDGARAAYEAALAAETSDDGRYEARVFLGILAIVDGDPAEARGHLELLAALAAREGHTGPWVAFGLDVLDLLEGAPGARAAFARRGPDVGMAEGRVRAAFTALVCEDRRTLAEVDTPEMRCARQIAASGLPLSGDRLRAALGALLSARTARG